jgi:hypothetical protein
MISFSVKNYDELIDFLEDNQGAFFDLILVYIEKCIEDNTEDAKIFDVTILDEQHTITFNCPKKNWHVSLKSGLEYYEENQEYEKCSKILELKKILNIKF